MSSSLEMAKESEESPPDTRGLSLFDQLKNSKDHNNVNKVATTSKAKSGDDKPKNENEKIKLKSDLNNSTSSNSNNSAPATTKEKPEFYPPSLPASSQSSAGGIGIIQATKRPNSQNTANTNLFGLKPATRDFNTLPQSLKRSQHLSSHVQHVTKKTALSSAKALGNLQSASAPSSSSLAALAAVFKPGSLAGDKTHLHHHHPHHHHHQQQQQQQQQLQNKKKRCTDRYDSSESSDSGVATSLSCTDSSTASSEDASEPGSPYSPPHQCLNEDQQLKQQQLALNSNSNNHNNKNLNTICSNMSPKTADATNTSKTTGGTVHNTSVASSALVVTTTASAASLKAPSSTSSSLCLRTNNLPAALTITPTTSSTSNGAQGNKAKQLHLTSTNVKNNNNTATLRCSNVPTLPWPWSTTTTPTSPSLSSSLAPLSTHNSTIANTTTSATISVAVTSLPAVTGNSTNTVASISSAITTTTPIQSKKRTIAPYTVADMPPAPPAAKKSRTLSGHAAAVSEATHLNTLTNHTNIGAKRLKAAALEESQTKITGYFKSQMKAQIQAAHGKGSIAITSGAALCNTNNAAVTTNALTMSAPATTASLNKYFNILAQLKENNKQANSASLQVNKANNAINNNNNNNLSSISKTSSVPSLTTSSCPISASIVNTIPNSQLNASMAVAPTTAPTFVTTNAKPMSNLSMQPVPMPALKKIERPKPTKIAQVAPNLRKTPSNNHHSYNHHSSNSTGKSPAKKHVAIAPRTPEMKQQMQQHQQQLLASKQDISKPQLNLLSGSAASQSTTNLTSTNTAPGPAAPAVLLTAIRLPTTQPQTQQAQGQSLGDSKPTLASNKLTQNVTNNPAVAPSTANAVPPPPTAATLYQLPTVQLPNLVQLPQLLAANGANIMQLNNLAAAANIAKSAQANAQQNSTNTATTNATHSTQQAAQAAAAQYFLNGTVFKLQQFTTATTTTATSASMGAPPANTSNPFNLLNAADLQDMLMKQQQQQHQLQQLQQQQQQQKNNLNNLAATSASSFQEIFQQQIAAAVAANQQQQQQQAQLQHLQRLGAAANIQQQPVFMATPTGFLLNAASLQAMFTQAAALAINNQHQQQQQQQPHQPKAIALPALQPIQPAPLPALSSIFAPQQQHAGNQQHTQQELHHQQLQQLALAQQHFINSTQPPPLATVALTSTAQQLTHNSNSNSSSVATISNSLHTGNQQQINAPLIGPVAPVNVTAATTATATNNTAKLAIVKANNNILPTNYTTLSSQPPPLVTISNRTHKTINNCTNNAVNSGSNSTANSKTIQNTTSKPYQKRSSGNNKQQNISGKSVNKSQGGKITTASGKIIATPTTPPPLVPTMTTAPQQPVALTPAPVKGIRSVNLKNSNIIPTPALVSISSTSTTAVQPKVTQSLGVGANSVTISPVLSTIPKSNQLVNIAPKLTLAATSSQLLNMKHTNVNNLGNSTNNTPLNMSTNLSASLTNNSTSTTKAKSGLSNTGNTKAITSTTDLFDLVKNSNGAISITPAPIITSPQITAAVPAPTPTISPPFNLTSNFTQNNFTQKIVTGTSATPIPNETLESLSKIKIEPLDEQICPIAIKEMDGIKTENPTSFSGQIPCNLKIKEEEEEDPMSPSNSQLLLHEERTEKSTSPRPNNILNNECSSSSSSFSSNSNSILVSSAADLSLEASTPASMTSSEPNSPPCSILSPLNNTCSASVTPNPCSNSNSVSESTSSNSCPMGASSRDMLSEMVTSTCICSDSSEASISVSLAENEESKLSSSEDKSSSCSSSSHKNDKPNRDVPTPESGIGGSLSNIESMDSSSKSSSTEISSSACSSDSTSSEIVNSPEPLQSDTQTPPATPLQSNEESQNESSSTASYLSQCQRSRDLTNSRSTSSSSLSSTSSKSIHLLSTTIDTKMAEACTKDAPKSAVSPILSQPKTIRFPASGGKAANKKQDGICYWHKCNKKHDSNSKLLDHMQHLHVNTQTGPFSCLWVGCKVYQKESCSRRWLERHVLSHGGSKQFKCIVEGCGLRFGSQLALQKHVNNHFTATETKESTSKRTSDPPVPKQLRKNGKKLRYRRQPFSARMFDFFDAGIMEGLQHRLRQISTLTNGCNLITFKGHCVMKRTNFSGNTECFVQWSPREIISDEWLPEATEPFFKTLNIKQMKPSEKNAIEDLLMTSYKMPYSPTIFEKCSSTLRQQYHAMHSDYNSELTRKPTTNDSCFKSTIEGVNNEEQQQQQQEDDEDEVDGDEDDDDNDNDNDDDDDEEDGTTTAETISSYQNTLTVNSIQMQHCRKHSRKPQHRKIITH